MSAILSHYVKTSIVTLDTDAPSIQDIEHKIETLQAFGAPFGVMTDAKGNMMGYAYGAPYRPKKGYDSSVELSIYLAPSHTSQGHGLTLLRWLVDACRQAGFKLAISVITVDPAVGAEAMPSGRVHRTAGFQYVGTIQTVARKFQRYWDTATFTLDLQPDRTQP